MPLIEGQDKGWPLWTYVTLAVGVVLLVVVRALGGRVHPPRPQPAGAAAPVHATLRSPAASILALVYFAAFTSIFFTISLLWQTGLGHTALESGVVSIPFAIGSIIASSQSNRLSQRLGRTVLVIGTALVSDRPRLAVARAAAHATRPT